MRWTGALTLVVCCLPMLLAGIPCPPKVVGPCEAEERYFSEQLVDHFSWKEPRRWSQRYLISDSHFDKANGPIFLYGILRSSCCQ